MKRLSISLPRWERCDQCDVKLQWSSYSQFRDRSLATLHGVDRVSTSSVTGRQVCPSNSQSVSQLAASAVENAATTGGGLSCCGCSEPGEQPQPSTSSCGATRPRPRLLALNSDGCGGGGLRNQDSSVGRSPSSWGRGKMLWFSFQSSRSAITAIIGADGTGWNRCRQLQRSRNRTNSGPIGPYNRANHVNTPTG